MTTAKTKPQIKPAEEGSTQKSPIVFGAARYRREIQWGLRHTPSLAERRRLARRAA